MTGSCLILRSTVFPGVTTRLDRRVAERGLQIDIAHCPERIAQGYALEELTRLPQIVGRRHGARRQRSAALFGRLGTKVIMLPPVEAELSKLFANAYRYISFAISNQFYVIAEQFGADFDRTWPGDDDAIIRGWSGSPMPDSPAAPACSRTRCSSRRSITTRSSSARRP